MVNIYRQYPTDLDIERLKKEIRQCDINEIELIADMPTGEAIEVSIMNSSPAFLWAYYVNDTFDNMLLCIAGCTTTGNPWLLGTDALSKYIYRLTKHCKSEVKNMLTVWPVLYNLIDARNTQTIRWLKKVGFTMEEQLEIKQGFPVILFKAKR